MKGNINNRCAFALNCIRSILFCLLPFTYSAYAAGDGYLYRYDTRPPDDVFKEGFSPWGDNADLVAHVRGDTSGTNAIEAASKEKDERKKRAMLSAYISASQSYHWARRSALSRLNPNLTQIYIYRIRQTEIFYNSSASIRSLGVQGFENRIASAQEQSEWLSRGFVPRELIDGAYVIDTLEPFDAPGYVGNPFYVPQAPRPNPDNVAMPLSNQPQQGPRRSRFTFLQGGITAGLAGTMYCLNPRSDAQAGISAAQSKGCSYLEEQITTQPGYVPSLTAYLLNQ